MFVSFFFPVAHAGVITDAVSVSSILSKVLQFLLSIVGVVAIIGLVVSGILYLLSGGDEKRATVAKRAFYSSVIGLLVALSALILVTQLVGFFS